jgi:serine/threonine-protein kinase
MKKPRVVIPDWLLGGGLTVLALLLFLIQFGPFEAIESRLYDLRARLRQPPQSSSNIAIVEIDDPSVAQLGRYPWPRSRIAEALDVIADGGARVIGLDILYLDPEQNQGLAALGTVQDKVRESSVALTGREVSIPEPVFGEGDPAAPPPPPPDALTQAVLDILGTIDELTQQLDSDTRLANAVALAQNVILPIYFDIGTPLGRPEGELPEAIRKNFVTRVDGAVAGAAIQGVEIRPPIPPLVEAAHSLGHINIQADTDGVLRSHVLLVDYQGEYFPSFATQIAGAYLNLEPDDIQVRSGGLTLGQVQVPTNPQYKMLVGYSPPSWTAERNQVFPYYSFVDVVNGRVQPEVFEDKIVLLGVTLTGLGEQNVTPRSPRLPAVEVIANVIENILDQNFLRRPAWATQAELALMILFGAFVSFGVPRLGAGKSAAITAVLVLVLGGAAAYLFVSQGLWIKVFYPAGVLLIGYTLTVSKRYFTTEQEKEVLEVDSIETNKMLGLSFQGQGMLDMAFEKFRKCPVEDVKDLLYNLGLDFERKRMFNKAVSVYEHIAKADPKYKDLKARMERVRSAGETVIFGGGGGMKRGADATVVLDGGAAATPTLGRYEILKELGRGAMGIVYLGKDPKINRTVAIKTLRLGEQELEPAELKSLRERFFREAESAGRLSHPNIVTIYDAGEDNEICYIAMELLDGSDLKERCPKDNLLDPAQAMELVATAAGALDYAHQQGIVYRDIKPANIMLLKDGTLKVTDFGIARITASSKTQTGTVMGTPSYMSPEQLMGKKVDGRSDLFSLTVVLYELLTGQKPFEGDSVATLMYKIANEPPPAPTLYNEALPPGVVRIIERGLEKDAEKRYQRGQELAAELRQVISLARPGRHG